MTREELLQFFFVVKDVCETMLCISHPFLGGCGAAGFAHRCRFRPQFQATLHGMGVYTPWKNARTDDTSLIPYPKIATAVYAA